METIKSFLTTDHRDCDNNFVEIEGFVAKKDWEGAEKQYKTFVKDVLHHFDMEEKVMFPILEETMGMIGGPTNVMRMEHQQIRDNLPSLEKALNNKNIEEYSGAAETIHILLQQHNMKEEQILYTMADQNLSSQMEDVLNKMKSL